MDLEVHRLRIGNWKPDAIRTVACDDTFSHNLAIGKENGEIEVSFLCGRLVFAVLMNGYVVINADLGSGRQLRHVAASNRTR